jgi:peptidoglycan/xylan/chitin deacetylase (PgdA/CDA1 family)
MIAASIATASRAANAVRGQSRWLLRTPLPDFRARLSNRLARHLHVSPLRWPASQPMVSFTFDDVPDSAVTVGARMLEEHGGRGTFYISGSLVAKRSEHWAGASTDDIVALHQSGHEIGCHTFSHRRAIELDAASLATEIEANQRFFQALDPSIRLANFAYPYGFACVSHKPQLGHAFASARGILPGVNSGMIDRQLLRAVPLIDCGITREGVEHAFDQAEATGGWLIFYSHDVAGQPSRYGCSPGLLRGAMEAATRRRIPMVTVAEALRQAGYDHATHEKGLDKVEA